MKIEDFINKYFGGNKSEFARANNVFRQQVNKWVKTGCIIFEGIRYSPRGSVVMNKNNRANVETMTTGIKG
ncbi:hypothetical protein L3033_004062 [Providencia stuartii]|uniref:Uncharacterized protein n=1 Tax=Providencia stuartii ATCC 25827 TaxID=471874 RepID=A0AA86YW50_PROST|nr:MULTISPECIES: hypothetical protein [Providencia]EDU58943.1 hypothetical protein PROSTU_02127 [Providencia stuartii ATCC 25827]KNZ83580.1 hypothetical protein AFL46_15000 [Providencia stuartii]